VAYQGLEQAPVEPDELSSATLIENFKTFITNAEPQWDADKKNQLFYL
jgi:hypothetical protein